MSWLNYFVIAGNKQIEINNFICLFYTVGEGSHSEDRYVDQDDQLLQFAIQQSLLDSECSSEPSQPLNLVEALDTFSKENSSPHPPRNTSIGRYGDLFLQWQIFHKKIISLYKKCLISTNLPGLYYCCFLFVLLLLLLFGLQISQHILIKVFKLFVLSLLNEDLGTVMISGLRQSS